MIVYERQHDFIMITQHEHAHLSGDLAAALDNRFAAQDDRRNDFLFAAREHDRGWIDLDSAPLWNDRDHCPYSFLDFPLQPRFTFYTKGIDEVQEQNKFAALLCSLLYTTLFERLHSNECLKYLKSEYDRQGYLADKLAIEREDSQLKHYLNLLLFCDELSLFLCMEEPGSPVSQYKFFAGGLGSPMDHKDKIHVNWKNSETLVLSLFPFQHDIIAKFPYKQVPKSEISALGITEAYLQSEWKKRDIRIQSE
ncbi:DUF3891 family protein [Paenibacillus solisilvae]|uniref:DUF3891 family protein n=1 Tax=Paenibacillus solisilvae TaxID=2486751 RepID=A0ABW0VVY6_9BACL